MITSTIQEQCLQEANTYRLTRSTERIKELGEVFTPTKLVLEILSQLPLEAWEEGKTYLDPTCGNGQFLAAVLIIKQSLGHRNPLATIYGVDIMQDNVDECRQRLINIAGDTPENWAIVRNNIRCENGLTYDYSFTDKPCDATVEPPAATSKPVNQKASKLKNTVLDSPLFG